MTARIPTIVHNGITVVTPYPVPNYTYDTITSNITGFGTYVINSPATLSFLHGVAAGQTINLNGSFNSGSPVKKELLIDDPRDFHAHVNMNYTTPTGIPFGKSPPGWDK